MGRVDRWAVMAAAVITGGCKGVEIGGPAGTSTSGTSSGGAGGQQTQQPQPIAYWHFEQDGKDASGNNHPAKLQGGAGFDTNGHDGYALSLDGNMASADVGAFDVGANTTFMAWARLPVDIKPSINTLLANANSPQSTAGFKIYVNNYGETDRALVVESGDGTTGVKWSSVAVTLGQWVHLAVVIRRGEGKVTTYQNGQVLTSSGALAAGFPTNQAMALGRFPNDDPEFSLRGSLDEVRIYDQALSDAQVAAIAKE